MKDSGPSAPPTYRSYSSSDRVDFFSVLERLGTAARTRIKDSSTLSPGPAWRDGIPPGGVLGRGPLPAVVDPSYLSILTLGYRHDYPRGHSA